MPNTRSTSIGFLKATHLVWLLLVKPARFLELEAENNKLHASANYQEEENALVVRRALFKSLQFVLISGVIGYIAGIVFGRAITCASVSHVSWLQIVGASLLLWGTLFIRGWEIQTYSGITLTERVNQWIYRALYCAGTATLVCSLAWPQCTQ